MAHFAIGRKMQRRVIWIGGLAVICCMATVTGIGRIGVIAMVAGVTIIGNGSVRALQWIKLIVNGELGGRPSRIGSVTHSTIVREMQRCVRRIHTCLIISTMAGIAGVWRIGVTAAGMAFLTILNIVPFRQWKEIVVDFGGHPTRGKHIMALHAVGGKSCLLVIGMCGSCVVLPVTINTCIAERGELQGRRRLMALLATHRAVDSG